jgi:hypothetical protein
MSGEDVHRYTREEFLDEFFPDANDQAAIAAGMEQLRVEQRAYSSPRCADDSDSARLRCRPCYPAIDLA